MKLAWSSPSTMPTVIWTTHWWHLRWRRSTRQRIRQTSHPKCPTLTSFVLPEIGSGCLYSLPWLSLSTGWATESSASECRGVACLANLHLTSTSYLAPVLRSIGISAPVKITLINAGLGESLSAPKALVDHLATWNMIFAIGASVKVEKFGRRPLFLTSVAGMLACYCIITGLSAGFARTKAADIGTAV